MELMEKIMDRRNLHLDYQRVLRGEMNKELQITQKKAVSNVYPSHL